MQLEAATLKDDLIVDSSGALSFPTVPKRLGIIGGGVIGLELGSVWRRLGSEVIILEAQEQFLGIADHQVSREALKLYRAQGLDIRLGTRVIACQTKQKTVVINYEDAHGGHKETVNKLVVAVGRQPNTVDLVAAEVGLNLDEWGLIHVGDYCDTNIPGVINANSAMFA